MKIELDKTGEEFYLHFTGDIIFTATPSGLCVLLTKPDLEKLVSFGQAELQDYLIGVKT